MDWKRLVYGLSFSFLTLGVGAGDGQPSEANPQRQAVSDYEAGLKAFRSGDYAEAEKRLSSASAVLQDIAGLQMALGLAKGRRGKTAEALKCFALAEESNDQAVASVACALAGSLLAEKGRLEEAEKKLSRAKSLDPSNPLPDELLVQICLAQNRLNLACQLLTGLAEKNPTDHQIAHQLGQTLLKTHQFVPAERALQTALELKSSDMATRYNLAIALVELNRLNDAAAHLKIIQSADPSFAAAKRLHALVLLRQGSLEQARESLTGYLEDSPEDAEAQEVLKALGGPLSP